MHQPRRILLSSALALAAAALITRANPQAPESDYNPPLAKASDEAQKAIPRFKTDKRFRVEVWAAEPLLAHPVAFAFDEQGRCYVAETFRHSRGVTDNRSHMNWLDDELAARTVADRVAVYKKYAKGKFTETYEKERERVRQLLDTDGDGKADKSTVFSDDFGRAEDGIGAGLLARHGNVYFTCIPDLWLLKDKDGDGRAEVKESLSTGYGVHVAFIGHDLHGLRMGPDGKLYFSVGDRGLNVKTKEGKQLFYPDTGAVLRCDPDGANLEVVHVGLRNPQELAFDDHGNLFTVDNNSDSGDQARWVYIAEGGDSGWRIGYQYGSAMGNRGPWNYEKLWHTQHEGQPAYVLPPLKHFSAGPSGFCYYPGVGLPEKYNGHFFLADFRGNSGGSGVWAFRPKPKGASFEMEDSHQFLWSVLATDCDFGPDGAFYVSDWVEGWNLNGKGRIYKLTDPEAMKNPAVAEAKRLLAEGFDKRPVDELTKLLEHPHQQVRLEAQFALAAKGSEAIEPFAKVAKGSKDRLARLHALWGLGMAGRKDQAAFVPVAACLTDADAEVRAQAAKVMGPSGLGQFGLAKLLKDPEPRVRYHAALALRQNLAAWGKERPGKLPRGTDIAAGIGRYDEVIQDLAAILRENNDRDPYLRHAAVMALSQFGPEMLDRIAEDPSPAVRRGVVLALRRQGSQRLDRFLKDPDPAVLTEAIRAIHDRPAELNPDDDRDRHRLGWLRGTLLDMAGLITRTDLPEPAAYRVINANFLAGHADKLAAYAARAGAPEHLRVLALRMLGDWAKPPRRDYVTGLTLTPDIGPPSAAVDALRPVLAKVFGGPAKVRQEAASAASRLGIKEVGPFLVGLMNDANLSPTARADALKALEALKDPRLGEAVKSALASDAPKLRNAARSVLAKTRPADVIAQLREVLEKGPVAEKQGALALLGELKQPGADALVEAWLDKLLAKEVPPELQLDVLEAASKYTTKNILQKRKRYEESRAKGDDLAGFREALAGGDAEAGRRVFLEHAAASCQRCHKLGGEGGEVGPPIDGIGARQDRQYLLEALVLPNKAIAKGYDSVIVTTLDGVTVSGVLRAEDGQKLTLITAEGKVIEVAKDDIDTRRPAKTAMPEDLGQKLSRPEVRDLVEFLAGLKEEPKKQ